MWGEEPSKTISLISNQLVEFQLEIPITQLPSKCTAAIQITKYMGFQYIWIDSLCIIQGSDPIAGADWEQCSQRAVH